MKKVTSNIIVTANEASRGKGFEFDSLTMKAFDESKRLANERIPQLKQAIKILKGNGKVL